MEIYEKYWPVPDLQGTLLSVRVSDGDEGIVVTLTPKSDKNRKLILKFGRVPAVRRILEECQLDDFTDGFWESSDGANCIIVRNSKWIAEFSEAELFHHSDPTHYVFFSDDQNVEVLSCVPPSVSWQS